MSETPFALFENPNGSHTLKDPLSGEVMHSRIGPWAEAELLYVEQSGLEQRLAAPRQEDLGRPLVIYDVGLGCAANSLAALECYERLGAHALRPLKVISFESELRGIIAALEHKARFSYLGRHEQKLRALLATGVWRGAGMEWLLRAGDFFDRAQASDQVEVIFYDFYSPASNPELWNLPSFRKVFALTQVTRAQGRHALLTTYSAATAVRCAMVLAGFYVGYGSPTPAKGETTLASTQVSDLTRPLGAAWLTKLEHSTKPYPYGEPGGEFAGFKELREKVGAQLGSGIAEFGI